MGEQRSLNKAIFFSLALLLLGCSQEYVNIVLSKSIVRSLPGFEGDLPFELETGYVSVDEAKDVHLFYYFVKSERKPK
ncbi:hypothetical protein Scep_024386 [Stephania cephalantha]|uniref:Lipoprotein n=1 Tax=Stephania cephalantha TaxID=152367 RepID=A0AAP0EWG1_9MAGN